MSKQFLFLYLALFCTNFLAFAQTTFTESAAAYNLNIGGSKDGGHAWADYDNDGDQDVLVAVNSSSNRNDLMRNNGDGTFTNVQATLAPGMLAVLAERQVAWGDLNNDGLPDFMMTSFGTSSSTVAIQIFIQNASGTFGDGIGGTAPITVGENASATVTINPLNVEGAGFFDFEGDGDLDIFFDSHAFGIELLRNNYIDHITHTIVNPAPSGLYTHITTLNGSPNVQFGLNQFATDGDYGTAADVDDDGWVDLFMRKRDENDFFLNQGGTFSSGSDLAQADNGNKGANGLWDLDNDGDLDAVWTENGFTQIFRNDGPGVWTALGGGVFPGLPQPASADSGSSSNDIDALAGGDVDNDGDIDIILVGDSRSYLFINQLNSPTPAPGVIGSGTAMTFTLDSATFNTGNGEGTTMIDIDDDGDLDIYMNINGGSNQLYINNLPAANLNNHLLVDVTEDRDASGTTGGFSGRTAIGTNVLIKDCEGNIISGLRQVNGVFGHGNQQPQEVHFGLPLGENETYIIEVHYPNFYDPVDGISRLIATIIATPSTIPGTNHYDLSTTDAEIIENLNPPDAVDDLQSVSDPNTISVQISLFDNDSEPDGENFFIDTVVQPAVGTVVIDDADLGLVTYTYSSAIPFPGTTFDYTITDSTVSICPALGMSDTATVTIQLCALEAGIIINEASNGPNGSKEWVELLVMGDPANPTASVDLTGWFFDDNNGDFNGSMSGVGIAQGSIVFGSAFNSVSPGSLILIYNNADKDPNITLADDPTDSDGDGVYILPGNHSSLSGCSNLPTSADPSYLPCTTTTASWSRTLFANGGDAIQTRKPDGTFYHGYSYGNVTAPFPTFPSGTSSFNLGSGGAGSTFAFQCRDWESATNFIRSGSAGRTPGVANSADNANFITNVINGNLDCTDLDNSCSVVDLELTKTVDNALPTIGDTITFTITVTNDGPSAASGIVVQDLLPAGLINIVATPSVGTYSAATGIWDLNSTLNLGDSETLTISADVSPSCGTINNTAEIIASTFFDSDSTPNNGG